MTKKCGKELSLQKRSAIIALRNAGHSLRDICALEKVSLNGVQYTLKRNRIFGTVKNVQRSGRPRVTTKQEDNFIRVTSKRDRFKTAPEIRSQLNGTRDVGVSVSTVKRRLKDANLKGRIAAKKPLLRTINKKKRLAWAKQHKSWTPAKWKKVLFTDESKFELFGSKRRFYVRRLPGERMLEQCIQPTVKHGGGSVMVWGCFGGSSVGDIVRIEGIMDKKKYHSILQRHAIPSGIRICGKGFVFQQDNDPKHTSILCKNYLENKQNAKVLRNMVWPPQSPDCNPIELLWDQLDRQVRETQITSQDHMWQVLQEQWQKIDKKTLNKLIMRMPRVCAAVIKARGGYFEESKI